MENIYKEQNIDKFFKGFKLLSNSYDLGKVHQLLNNPDAKATHKVNFHLYHLKLIIMTSTILILLSGLFLWIRPLANENKHITINNKANQNNNTLISRESPDGKDNRTTLEYDETGNQEQVESSKSNKRIEKSKKPLVGEKTSGFEDKAIKGNKFILDLTFDELRKLGFNISHYSVFYQNADVIFYSMHQKLKFGYKFDSISFDGIPPKWISHDLTLQTDTFPVNTKFFYVISKGYYYVAHRSNKPEIVQLDRSNLKYYPVFATELDGTTHNIFEKQDFEQQNDTLVPIVIRFSQMNTGRKKDLIFWFTPSNELFDKLPERYLWLKEEISKIKKEKSNNPNQDYVEYDIQKWVQDQLFHEDAINGENFIISLEDKELEKLGCYRNKKGGGLKYRFKTIEGGVSTGYDAKIIDGKPPVHVFDSAIYTDYLPVFNTLSNGNTRSFSTTTKELDQFLIDNDVALPVLVKNPSWKDEILWFSLSENFWKLIPERYQYLKVQYDKILFNKSFYPEKDLVKYFPEPFNRIDINVNILQLNKEELENIGFKFNEEDFSIDCAIDSSWIRYEAYDDIDTEYLKRMKERMRSDLEKFQKMRSRHEKFHLHENITYRSPNGRMGLQRHLMKSDSLRVNANQGFLFFGITDTSGRVLNMINLERFMGSDKNINTDLLIPILVRQSKYFNKKFEDKVFWFTPTKEFIERLPDRYRKDLQDEIELLKSNSTGSCTYFEICKSTLDLDNFKLYPNPANNSVTIEFEARDALEGSVSIVNIAGVWLKTLIPNTTFLPGHNMYQMDLSGITPGIYLISVDTDKGFKTQRLIVSP